MSVLKKLRLNKGLSQKEVSESLGWSLRSYQEYESEKREISSNKIQVLAEYYSIPKKELHAKILGLHLDIDLSKELGLESNIKSKPIFVNSSEVINKILIDKNINASELAAIIGASKSTITNILNEVTKGISNSLAIKIATKYPEYKVDFLKGKQKTSATNILPEKYNIDLPNNELIKCLLEKKQELLKDENYKEYIFATYNYLKAEQALLNAEKALKQSDLK